MVVFGFNYGPAILALALVALGYALVRSDARRNRGRRTPPDHREGPPGTGRPDLRITRAAEADELDDPKEAVYAAAAGASEDLQRAVRPSHMLGCPGFEAGVEAMRSSPLSNADLLGFYTGDSVVLAVCAAEALARRPADRETRERLLQTLNDFHPFSRYFGLRAIAAATAAPESAIALVLRALDGSWQAPPLRSVLAEFLDERFAAGDHPTAQAVGGDVADSTCELLGSLLGGSGDPRVREFLAGLAALKAARVDEEFLRSVGTLGAPDDDGILVEHRDLVAWRDAIVAALEATPPRPVLLVGAPGTGRSSLVLAVWRVLRDRGWNLFQAGHMELLAGQSFMGQFEERVSRMMDELERARRTLWVAPSFQAFLYAGRHQSNPTGLIDLILPAVAGGRFPLIAVTEPAGFELIVRNKPTVLTSFEVMRLEPLGEAASLAVAREWDRRRTRPPAELDDGVLREASHLAHQYLGHMAAPGNLLHLLTTVVRQRSGGESSAVTVDEVVASVGRLTGLPAGVLDERQGLDLAEVTRFFATRVVGQPEAVETLVERVAMIKAGVTDPTRPLGVFLFAGPTGTGKTEIAKTLAEYLFGSADRLVRIDMSELQTPESLSRLLGDDSRDLAGNALVDQIRRHPFSVVLLDEFEKSHPQVWDLFLQVFDDGRLTDRRGITADFRNCIIILTSNLGAALPRGPGLGFGGGSRPSAETVEHSVARTFRPEFFNRIDRLIVFRPLSRDVLREILHKELRDVFRRRGLRNRDWAVIWDDTAIDFLLDRGTTPDLGARPLRRAIERHVLAPLARAIVEHEYPRGDQFLFVRGGGERLEVEFVDPDIRSPEPDARLPPEAHEAERLESVALDPRGTDREVPCLETHLEGLVKRIEDEAWRERKRAALQCQREDGFWDSPRRFAVFGLIEQMDRVEAGVRAAASLFERLRGTARSGRTRFASDHAGRLALRLFLLETAVADVQESRPLDAFLMVENASGPDVPRDAVAAFAARLLAMYRAWGASRGMKVETVVEEDAGGRGYRVVLAVSGLGAHTLLAPEAGLHLLEEPNREGRSFDRVQLRVRVAPQPESPPSEAEGGLRRQAGAAFEAQAGSPLQVVRRYRERPSPLVRDTVRGWRTGRIDRVFGGAFDLLAAARVGGEEADRGDA